MYDFFKNIAEKNSCMLAGACSVHPSVNALYQIILNEIREIASYLVKLKTFNIVDKEAVNLAIEGLSIFLINTSYNQQNYLDFVNRLNKTKNNIKEKYISYCEENGLPCEIIKSCFDFKSSMSISDLINYAQNNFLNMQKNFDKVKFRLFELITLFARLCAIEAIKIKKMAENFDEYNFEILRFFALTNSYSIRNEKLIRRIYEFSDISLKISIKLSSLYQQKYGIKESANANSSLLNGHCILVSGDDLDELDALLKTIEEADIKETINVYTHGSLFLAHFYPYFKKNKFLKGHFGSDNVEYDFSVFDGAILITQNFIQKIDSLYRGEIFSNKLISFSKVIDIKEKNYKPVIESALKLDGCKKSLETSEIKINYDRQKIKKFIEQTNVEEIVVISGLLDGKDEVIDYEDKKIIKISSFLEGDILFESIKKLKEKGIKITVFLAQCNLINLNIVLTLLNQDIDLHIANCPHVLINPHVIEALKEDFNVKII